MKPCWSVVETSWNYFALFFNILEPFRFVFKSFWNVLERFGRVLKPFGPIMKCIESVLSCFEIILRSFCGWVKPFWNVLKQFCQKARYGLQHFEIVSKPIWDSFERNLKHKSSNGVVKITSKLGLTSKRLLLKILKIYTYYKSWRSEKFVGHFAEIGGHLYGTHLIGQAKILKMTHFSQNS